MESKPQREIPPEGTPAPSTPEGAGRRRGRLLLDLFLLLSLLAASWGYWLQPECHPPYLDYDSATLGIFVNNLSYNSGYDDHFRGYRYPQHRYRTWWAAEFLPLGVPFSLLQRLLGIPPEGVTGLLRVLGILFALLGSLAALSLLRKEEGWIPTDRLFFLGFLAAAPPFLLFVRTLVPHFMFTFFLFWILVRWTADYCRSGDKSYLYLLGLGAACFAMAPYPFMFFLPPVFLFLTWRAGRLKETFLDLNLLGALLLAGLFFFTVTFVLAWSQGESYPHLMEKAYKFLQSRGGAISLSKLSPSLLPDKITKLLNQHLLFLRDDLGDWTRDDALWTLGSIHVLWLLALPLGLFGLYRGLRERRESARVFAAVLFSGYLTALTISFPEGRYLLPLVPCYAYFAASGLRALLPRIPLRKAAAALLLLLLSGNTYLLVSGPGYDGYMADLWKDRGGMRDALRYILRSTQHPERYALGIPTIDNEEFLYYQVYANFRVTFFLRKQVLDFVLNQDRSPDPKRAAEELSRILLLRRAGDRKEKELWEGFGFHEVHRFREPCTGRSYVLMCRGKFPPKDSS